VDWLEDSGGMGGFQWDRKALAVMSGMVGRPVRVESGDGDRAVQWAGRVLRAVDTILGAWWKGGGTRGTERLAHIWEKRHWLRRLLKGWRAQGAGWAGEQEEQQEEGEEQTAEARQGKRRGRPRKGATDWRMGWRLMEEMSVASGAVEKGWKVGGRRLWRREQTLEEDEEGQAEGNLDSQGHMEREWDMEQELEMELELEEELGRAQGSQDPGEL